MKTARSMPWFRMAMLSLVVVLALSLFPSHTKSLGWWAMLDAGHAPFFALLGFALLRAARAAGRPRIAMAAPLLFVGLTLFGGAVEGLQSLVGRDSSWTDLGRDAVGVLSGLLMAFSTFRPRRVSRAIAVLAAGLLVWTASSPLIWAVESYGARDRAFPVLFDVERDAWHPFVVTRNAKFDWKTGSLRFWPAEYPAFILREPHHDWTSYRQLIVALEGGEHAPAEIWLRIDDRGHDGRFEDRFQRAIPLAGGAQEFTVPLSEIRAGPSGRELDLSRIASLALYLDHPARPQDVRLRGIRLE